MSVVISGHSDDLIEIEGDIEEEFVYRDAHDDYVNLFGMVLALSDGSAWSIRFGDEGWWRIVPIINGTNQWKIESHDGQDEVLTIDGDFTKEGWVVAGRAAIRFSPTEKTVQR